MKETTTAPMTPKWMYWTGWVLTVLLVLVFLMAGSMKIIQPDGGEGEPTFEEQFAQSGWPVHLAIWIGVIEITCAVIYLIPKTAVSGAVLLTGFMGGAIATHLRLEEPPIAQVIIGLVIWGALWLRDAGVRELLPLRR